MLYNLQREAKNRSKIRKLIFDLRTRRVECVSDVNGQRVVVSSVAIFLFFFVVNVVAISCIVVSVLAIFWLFFCGERCGNISPQSTD